MTEIMAVMNLTPDSFSDGGRIGAGRDAVLSRAASLINEGASWLDLGGESTRPGAAPVSVQQELDRVMPALEWIKAEMDVRISLDTSTAEVMHQGIKLGADMINDVRALTRDGALEAVASSQVPVVLMHMLGEPQTMQLAPEYRDVVADVESFLTRRVADCEAAGIERKRILLDPGFGFGKTLAHNIELFKAIDHFQSLGFPTLIGVSRKTMIGEITGQPLEHRATGSAVAAAMAAQAGARFVRVHDVHQTRDAIKIMEALTK